MNLLYNPDLLPSKKIWGKNPVSIARFNNPQFKWFNKLYEQMRNNFWIPQKVNVAQDSLDYGKLTPAEYRSYKGILGFLVFLDSIQTTNLPNFSEQASSQEIKLCLTEQTSQEFLHSQSYQFLIDSVLPVADREEVYNLHKLDSELNKRCHFIASQFQSNFVNAGTDSRAFLQSLIMDYVLESVFFYSGFNFFYTLSSRGLMGGTADMIKLIHRDELTHVLLFEKLIQMTLVEHDLSLNESKTIIYDLFEAAYESEKIWLNHILGDSILGMNQQANDQFLKYIINKRLDNIGLDPLFEKCINPYRHLDKIADLTHQASNKANFFESGVTSYTQSSSVSNWDF